MNDFVVLYRDETVHPLGQPLVFKCQADYVDHAEEQCENARPGADIVWVWHGRSSADAYDDYYCFKEG